MNKHSFKVLVVLPALFLCSLCMAQETIHWLLTPWAPVVIREGQFKNQGVFELTVERLIEKLPQYQHKKQYVNGKRLFAQLEQNRNNCGLGAIKTSEREEIAYYSIAHSVLPSHSFLTTQDKSERFKAMVDQDGLISLEELLVDHQDLRLGIVGGRSYGKTLDEILNKYKNQRNIHKRTGRDMGPGILAMLSLGRVDYAIEYPFATILDIKEKQLELNPYTLPIKELKEDYIYVHIVCSKTIFGEQMIKDINRVIRQEIGYFLKLWYRWYDPNTIRRMETQEIFKKMHHQ